VSTTRRSTVAAIAAISATALALSACGGSQGSASDGTVGGEIGYSYWGSPARAEKVDAVIDLFEAAEPDASVTGDVADYTAYVERLTVRAAGGGLSCLIGTQSTFATPYATQGVLRPLDDLIESGELDTSGLPADVVEAGQIDGEQYIMPTAVFLRLLGYNEQLIEQSGAPAPSNDFTWEEYVAWLRTVQAGLPAGTYAAEIEAVNMFSLTSWVVAHDQQMFDGDEIAFDRELLVEWFELWLQLGEEGVTVPPSTIADHFGALELTPMATGIAASATRDIPHLYINELALQGAGQDTRVKAVSMPVEPGVESANILGINGISMPTTCDNVATAAAFADFFANDVEAGVAFQSDNGIVANTDAQAALLADASTPEGVKQNITILQGLVDSGDTATTTYPASLNSLTAELRRAYEDAAFGRVTVDQAVDAFFAAGE
jgi:multiple sugar transport system substrate-binding protein